MRGPFHPKKLRPGMGGNPCGEIALPGTDLCTLSPVPEEPKPEPVVAAPTTLSEGWDDWPLGEPDE